MAEEKERKVHPAVKVGVGLGLGVMFAAMAYALTRKKPPAPPPPPPEGLANLYGQVIDAQTGQAIPDVLVILDSYQALTDLNGYYVYTDLEPKAYTISFSKEGYETETAEITLIEGNNELSLALTPVGIPPELKARLYGDVSDAETGELIKDVLATVNGLSMYTGAWGEFDFEGLELRTYTITFTKANYAPYSATVTLTEGDNLLIVQLQPVGMPIDFEVRWMTVEPLTVTAGDPLLVRAQIVNISDHAITAHVVCSINGMEFTEDVPLVVEDWEVVIFRPTIPTPGTYVVSVAQFSERIEVIAGVASLYGAVIDSVTEEPLANVLVTVGIHQTATNSLGEYSFLGLGAKKYAIVVEKEGYQTYSAQVSLSAGDNILDVTLTPVGEVLVSFTHTPKPAVFTWPITTVAVYHIPDIMDIPDWTGLQCVSVNIGILKEDIAEVAGIAWDSAKVVHDVILNRADFGVGCWRNGIPLDAPDNLYAITQEKGLTYRKWIRLSATSGKTVTTPLPVGKYPLYFWGQRSEMEETTGWFGTKSYRSTGRRIDFPTKYIGELEVVETPIVTSNFVYSDVSCPVDGWVPGSSRFKYVDFHCTLTNTGDELETHKVSLMKYRTDLGEVATKEIYSEEITLSPGESRTFSYRFYQTAGTKWCIWLRDDGFAESERCIYQV